jgi:tagatose 6-phosphate kinase
MILVVGLSPAWQRTLEYDRFVVGKVNRARRVSETASGKGVNVARVAQQLGAKVRLLTVAGGHWGRLLKQSLREEGLNSRIINVRSETRICQTLLATGFATTELVEETRPLTKSEVSRVLSCFARDVRKAKMVVLSGTVPPGCGDDFYARLIREANRRSIPVLIDTQRAQLLNAVKERPFLVKINRDELGAAVGISCDRVDGLRRAARRLADRGAQRIVLTHGSEGVYAFEDSLLKGAAFKPPRVKAQNPIGSGDAMLAGVACGLWRGETFLEALRLGIACGSANAMTREPGHVRLGDVARLVGRV